AANATFLPSGESARSWNWLVSRRCSGDGPAGAPTREIGTSAVLPEAVSSFQIRKFRSKTIVSPRAVADGHSTRPSLNAVTLRGTAPAVVAVCQMVAAPLRSDTQNTEH